MKQITFAIISVIALVCAIGFGLTARTNASEKERWEYTSMPGQSGMAVAYNHLGNDGWELTAVSCSDRPMQCHYYFKRRK